MCFHLALKNQICGLNTEYYLQQSVFTIFSALNQLSRSRPALHPLLTYRSYAFLAIRPDISLLEHELVEEIFLETIFAMFIPPFLNKCI